MGLCPPRASGGQRPGFSVSLYKPFRHQRQKWSHTDKEAELLFTDKKPEESELASRESNTPNDVKDKRRTSRDPR